MTKDRAKVLRNRKEARRNENQCKEGVSAIMEFSFCASMV